MGFFPCEATEIMLEKPGNVQREAIIQRQYLRDTGKGQCRKGQRIVHQQLDGVKLFSLYSKLSRDITLRYTNSRIIASVPKTKDSLNMVIRAIETAREAKR